MTDAELGRAIVPPNMSIGWDGLEFARMVRRARELLAPPIARMSVEECRTLAKETWAAHKGSLEASIYAVGDAFHRLAQPAARVDEDARARAKALRHHQARIGPGAKAEAKDIWQAIGERERQFWRGEAAKETGDA